MKNEEIIRFIRTIPIFYSLTPAQLEQVAEAAVERGFDAEEHLLEHEQDVQGLFIVVSGELQAYIREEQVDFERELTRLYPGDYFGMVAMLTRDRSQAAVRALTAGRVLVISREKVDAIFETSPAFGQALCRSLALNVKESIDHIPTVPFRQLDTFSRMRASCGLLPLKIVEFCQALAVDSDENRVQVAMVNPGDTRARDFIKNVLHPRHVEFVAVSAEDFDRHVRVLTEQKPDLRSPAPLLEGLAYIDGSGAVSPIQETSEEDLLPRVLSSAIRSGASDVHIEPGDPDGRVRLRIDGRLMTIEDGISVHRMRHIVSRIKVMSDLDITRTRRPQDGRILAVTGERRIEFRVSVVPCQGGEKIVLRVIAPDTYLGSLSNLVVSEPVARFVESVFDQPSGLVLVTGPAGAGKTTTLYAALNRLSVQRQTSNFVTIEDPIEYNLDYATQIQVNQDLGLNFSDILRSVLRQDPNIILVGEIRDEQSAAIAVEAATTGHLVLSSLHTHSTLETLVRLRNLEVKPYLLAGALRGVISQHLVPRLVPGLTEPVPVDDPVVQRLKHLDVLEPQWSGTLYRAQHAKDGLVPGESGRVAVYEILSVSDAVRDLIDRAAPAADVRKAVDEEAFFSFARYSRLLLANGLTAPEHIEKIFPKRPTLMRF